MTATAQINLTAQITGLPDGARVLAASYAPATPVEGTLNVALTTGDNTIAVPAGANAVLLVPPAGGTVTLRLKAAGDASGWPIGASGFAFVPLASGTTSVVINASGAVTVTLDFI